VAVRTGVLPERYLDARVIGRGGMGEIYLAEDRELGRKVAVKVLDERFAENDQLRKRFKREALTAARLSGHPHVVTIFDVGEWRSQPFIVMEYLPAGTLADRARSGPLDRRQALEWLRQAAEALDDAHKLGVVHRDVKPANLLLDSRGDLAVADFGIARVADDTTGMTAAGTVLGTAGYLAPEQALGEPATPASDRYALGVVAYELLTGGRPFERGSATAEAAAHIHESVPPASQRGVGLPFRVDAVFERILAKDPVDRFPTASGFVAALDAALAEAEQPTRALVASAPISRPTETRDDSRNRSFFFPLLVAAMLLALVGGVVAAVFATSDGNSSQPAATAPLKPEQVTVTKKVLETQPGTTVVQTVVTTVPVPAAPAGGGSPSVSEAVALTDQATYALRRGAWADAARLAQRAYKPLESTYSDSFRYEAYVNFDLGKALAELGRCNQALVYLDHSEELQGHRREIDEARATCAGSD
jgi:serine/threonine protein kinase